MDGAGWLEQAEGLLEQKLYTEALDLCDRTLEENPRDLEALLFKGYVLADFTHQNEKALLCYEEALGIDDTSPRLWLLKGKALYNLSRLRESIA